MYKDLNLHDFDDLDFIVPQHRMEEQCIVSGLVMGHGTRAIRFSSGSAGDL